MPQTRPSETASELIAALMWKSQTRDELSQATGAGRDAVGRWLVAFHQSGIVRVGGYVENPGGGRRARIWEMQSKPFASDDVPVPPRRDE